MSVATQHNTQHDDLSNNHLKEHGGHASEGYGRTKTQGADFSHGIALYLEKVSVWFDAFRALNDLSLYIEEGELRCIIGPNGAGKTTLMDVITGKTRPTEGTAFFGQHYDLAKMSTEEIAEAGIGRKFQKPTVFENFTVMENLLLAAPRDKRVFKSFRSKLSSDAQQALDESLAQIRLEEFGSFYLLHFFCLLILIDDPKQI